MPEVPGWPDVFRGSTALEAGLVTRSALYGPQFRRIYPDTFVAARLAPPDLRLRSLAAHRYTRDQGILAGYSAAELLGASCAPRNAPAEVIVDHHGQRGPTGLVLRRERITPDEIVHIDGIPMTSPVRTAFDLARRHPLLDAVIAVDRLANVHRFRPEQVLDLAAGQRGVRRLTDVVAHADARAESPMETRLRMIIVTAGLPRPEVQCAVQDERNRTVVWLDLAYPDDHIGIEYDGATHTEPDAVLRDIGRHTALLDRQWRVYRYTKLDIFRRPDRIVDQVRRALERRDRARSA